MGTVSIWIYTLSQLEKDNALLEKFNKKTPGKLYCSAQI